MIHPLAAIGLLLGGLVAAWFFAWYVTDMVVGSRKPGRRKQLK